MSETRSRALASALVTATLFLSARASAESTFDPAAGALRLPDDALRTWGFETNDGVAGLELASWVTDGMFFTGKKTRAPLTPDVVAAHMTSATGDAVEGKRALRLGDAYAGIVISDPALWQSVATSRFEVVLWIRADGTEPSIAVRYDQDPDTTFTGSTSLASVRAIRTGRETSDGWVEMSTGPIGGSVLGAPVRSVEIMPSIGEVASDRFLVDALEVRAAAGTPTPAVTCTQTNLDAVCGATADCLYGRCVPDTAVWGALPSSSHRHELVERWIHWATHLMGDRKAIDIAFDSFTPAARALADEATSSRRFFAGMARLVNQLRDNHTSFGSPLSPTTLDPYLYERSDALGACFGVVDKDILGGGRGYAVFRAGKTALTGTTLQVGDVVSSIDGEDPEHWLDDNWTTYAPTLPNDPSADPSSRGLTLASLISRRASTVTLLRCASATTCDPEHRQPITIDVTSSLAAAVTKTNGLFDPDAFACSTRFLDSIPGLPPDGDVDTVHSVVGPTGTTLIQFDGFSGDTAWDAAMTSAFASSPATVVLDARIGHGGATARLKTLLDQVRGTSDPFGYLTLERGSYDRSDPITVFNACFVGNVDYASCVDYTGDSHFTSVASPPAGSSKIAWLQSYDVSANDYASRLLKGRKALQSFGPHPTSGAFGGRQDLPPLVTAWTGGSIQIQDTRFASSPQSLASARWESGSGVAPDVVVAQKVSDALVGVDTIMTTAATWLATH